MVTASSQGKRKKKAVRKGGKRKPVNLQANFNRKCAVAGSGSGGGGGPAVDHIHADMFPPNHDEADDCAPLDGNAAPCAAGDCSAGDFHLHRCGPRRAIGSTR